MPARWFARIAPAVMVLSVVLLTGCSSWQVQPGPPDVVLAQTPDRARITTSDGDRLTLKQPAVHDSLVVGIAKVYSEFGDEQGETRVIPVAAITRIELRGTAALRTWMLLLTPLAAYVAFGVAFAATW